MSLGKRWWRSARYCSYGSDRLDNIGIIAANSRNIFRDKTKMYGVSSFVNAHMRAIDGRARGIVVRTRIIVGAFRNVSPQYRSPIDVNFPISAIPHS